MTTQDERTSVAMAAERIDRVARWLEVTLGARLTAYAAGVSQADVYRFASGSERPAAVVEERLRNLFDATWFIAAGDGPGSAHDWLTEPNRQLGDRTPAELLRSGAAPKPAWFSVDPVF